MIFMDHGATSFPKPPSVIRGVERTLRLCANPGRGGYTAAREADRIVYRCREAAAAMFGCREDQVVFTQSCTHGLNIAIRDIIRPGMKVAVSGFEHNAVVRPLAALDARLLIFGRKLFRREDTLQSFREALDRGAEAAVFTHVSNVFGYILPVEEMAALCRQRGIPFVVDAAQSGGLLPVKLEALGADYIAMPGHKGLLGPQGTGLLLCGRTPAPLLFGGTGTASRETAMPEELPERLEAGTLNVPGIGGLLEGLRMVERLGPRRLFLREQQLAREAARLLEGLGLPVFRGPHQGGTVSFLPRGGCQELADRLARRGIALRAGLHCAPLAHESAGTLETGTLRLSFGWNSEEEHLRLLERALRD